MSTNHHTPIAQGAARTSAVLNAPLSQLDAAIDAVSAGTPFSIFSIGAPVSVTIASGIIVMTTSFHQLITEGGGATDDLDTINGGTAGYILFLKNFSTAYTITVRHNVGNIYLNSGQNYNIATFGSLALFYDGSFWHDFGLIQSSTVLENQVFS